MGDWVVTVDAEAVGVEVDQNGQPVHLQDDLDLTLWLDPLVPPPMASVPGTSGWERIRELGGWGCGLSPFRPMAAVPAALKEKWGKVVADSLRQVLGAMDREQTELDNALLWFLALPQAMLRQGKRGGKKGQNVAEVGRRFDCALAGNWGELLDLLLVDREEDEKRREAGRRRRRPRTREKAEDKERQRETVLNLMSKGQVGKASRRISSHGLASTADPATLRTVLAKYVERTRELPASVRRGQDYGRPWQT